MSVFITRGRYTHNAIANMIANPEDRWENDQKLVEAVGGKLLDFYLTYGSYDFLMICEADSAEQLAPALLAAGGTGGVNDITTFPAMTTADAKIAFEGAQRASASFKPATG